MSRERRGTRDPRAPRPERGDAPATEIRESALRLLERSRRTRSDLARRLREKGYAAPAVGEVLDRLAEVGLVDDVEFARAFLAGRWGRKAAGWRRLEAQLRQKGVSAEDATRGRVLLEEREGRADEVSAARRAITQAERRYADLEPRLRRQRLWALLARRGFDGEVIEQALAPERDAAG